MNRLLIFIFIFINYAILGTEIDGFLESKIDLGTEKRTYSIITGELYPEVPKTSELFLNFEETVVDNDKSFQLENNKEKTAIGLKYSYYGIKGLSLGIKGSLENNYFLEEYKNSFDFKNFKYDQGENKEKSEDEYYKSYRDFGLKLYGEAAHKTENNLVLIMWNELTLDKLESNLPKAHESIEPTITITPKVIYENKILENSKFLTEVFLENRQYFNRKIDLEGKEKDFYSKFVLTQHLIFDEKLGENFSFMANNSLTYEQINGNKNGQLILKISPRLKYTTDKLDISISGGEFRFQDEMGMTYDFYELFAYKLVGNPNFKRMTFEDYWKYEANCFSLKSNIRYKILKNYVLGSEVAYRKGEYSEFVSELKSNSAYLTEKSYGVFGELEKNLQNNLNLKGSLYYERKIYNENLLILMDNINDYGIRLSLKYHL